MPELTRFQNAVETIGRIEEAADPREAVNEFSTFVSQFGFSTLAISEISNPAIQKPDKLIQFSNWPTEWVDFWLKNRLIISDPIAKMALTRQTSFHWSEAFRDGNLFAKNAQKLFFEYGFTDGLAIPVRTGFGLPGCVSLGKNNIDISPQEQATIELIAIHCYAHIERLMEASSPSPTMKLSPRQSEILHFVAAGKTNWEIGKILSLSEFYVRDCIKGACKKLNAVGRTHAVASAIRNNEIFP